jgi:hypothetical protein
VASNPPPADGAVEVPVGPIGKVLQGDMARVVIERNRIEGAMDLVVVGRVVTGERGNVGGLRL